MILRERSGPRSVSDLFTNIILCGGGGGGGGEEGGSCCCFVFVFWVGGVFSCSALLGSAKLLCSPEF